MKVLIVKLTSMGDALHLLPVLTELAKQRPDIEVDWMIEESFAEIPAWHPIVRRVIPVATRRWRRIKRGNFREIYEFFKSLRSTHYDVVIDAQGLMKSAVFARLAKIKSGGRRAGFSGKSIKEGPAAWLYKETYHVARTQHAIDRLHDLFRRTFGLHEASKRLDYGLLTHNTKSAQKTVMFLHGTTWSSKHLPPSQWRQLRNEVIQSGFRILLPWGNEGELERAQWIAQDRPEVEVLPKLTLTELKNLLQSCQAAIAVDTGLGHLAAALNVPTISIYGSTNAKLTGAMGQNQTHLQTNYSCSPCLLKECARLQNQQTDPPCYSSLDTKSIITELQQLLI